MPNQQLLSFINEEQRRQISKEQIKSDLLAKGWPPAMVDEAFAAAAAPQNIPQGIPPAAAPSQPPLQSAPLSMMGDGATKKISKRMWMIIAAVVLVVLLVGGGAYAYFGYYLSTDRIIGEMYSRLGTVTTAQYSGELSSSVQETAAPDAPPTALKPADKPQTVNISFSGSSDFRQVENLNSYVSLNVKTNALPEAMEASFGVDVRNIGNMLYLKLATSPAEKEKGGIFDFSALNDQWVSVDIDAARKEFGILESDAAQQEAASKKTAEITAAVKRHQLIAITGQLPAEKIDGVNTFHFSYEINKEEAKKLAIEIQNILRERVATAAETAEVSRGLDAISTPKGELWIGKKDYLPYKMTLTGGHVDTSEGVTATAAINLTLFLKKFNEPVIVEKPEAITFQEAFAKLFGASIPTSFSASGELKPESITPDNSIIWGADSSVSGTASPVSGLTGPDADKDGLPDDMEAMFGTDPKKADTDGDGFNDYSEIENGYNPLGQGKLN